MLKVINKKELLILLILSSVNIFARDKILEENNIFGTSYFIGVNISGLDSDNEIVVNVNGNDSELITQNGLHMFPTPVLDGAVFQINYEYTLNSTNQQCNYGIGEGGFGSINGENNTNLSIDCIPGPFTVADNYTVLEDHVLIANDVDGSVNDANDDSVLVNDTSFDQNFIGVVPGTYPVGGIGGTIVIAYDGTFSYTPPNNVFGTAIFEYEVFDHDFTKLAILTVEVLPVNDAPSFAITCDIDTTDTTSANSSVLIFYPNFVNNMNTGSTFESSQIYNLTIDVAPNGDPSQMINSIDVSNNGQLVLNLNTLITSVATINLTMTDSGGVTNGGVNQVVQQFNIHNYADVTLDPNYINLNFGDYIYKNTFDLCR